MDGKLIITKKNEYVVCAMYEEQELVELDFEPIDLSSILGNIYTGKVKNIVKNINAAFVEISGGILCYYSLTENKEHIFLNTKKNNNLVVGDEILLQISRENVKTKAPVGTCHINLTGKYIVLTAGKNKLGISNKIKNDAVRKALKELVTPHMEENYGLIVRTNAAECDADILEKELIFLKDKFHKLKETSKYRTSLQLIEKGTSHYISNIRDQKDSSFQRIVTDDKEIYDDILEYLTAFQPEDQKKLEFYDDETISLSSLMNLNKKMDEAFKEKVWLKSGGYLVIQPTEAMVVIDVNTGKAINKKKRESHFLSINLEAAKEIARQLRLRNLSGIILIDFIDMQAKEDRDTLMAHLDSYLKKDRMKAVLVGISRLNLVEITRKRAKKPIYEQVDCICPRCKGIGMIHPCL